MKVVVVTTSYPSSEHPVAGTFVHGLVEAARGAGVTVEVVSPSSFPHFGVALGAGIAQNLRAAPWKAALVPAFLASFSLALALSTQIQLRGRYPLEFFFLDEGFGTLDSETLEVVFESLGSLRTSDVLVGFISHVEDLKQRLPRSLVVTPAEPGGQGSTTDIVIA